MGALPAQYSTAPSPCPPLPVSPTRQYSMVLYLSSAPALFLWVDVWWSLVNVIHVIRFFVIFFFKWGIHMSILKKGVSSLIRNKFILFPEIFVILAYYSHCVKLSLLLPFRNEIIFRLITLVLTCLSYFSYSGQCSSLQFWGSSFHLGLGFLFFPQCHRSSTRSTS